MCVGSFEPQAYIPTKQTNKYCYCEISFSTCHFWIWYVTNIIKIIILGYNFVVDSEKYVFLVAIEVFYDLFISTQFYAIIVIFTWRKMNILSVWNHDTLSHGAGRYTTTRPRHALHDTVHLSVRLPAAHTSPRQWTVHAMHISPVPTVRPSVPLCKYAPRTHDSPEKQRASC